MKTTVIHHSADYDGIFCREIARKFLPEAKLIGWDFSDKPLSVPDGQVYILDLPIDSVFGWKFNAIEGIGVVVPFQFFKRVVWIDHHKSSIESHPSEIPGCRIDGVSACRLAWQWFASNHHGGPNEEVLWALPKKDDYVNRTVTEPFAVRLAGEYDIWDKRDPDAESFQFGLRSEELSLDNWNVLLSKDGLILIDRLLNQGKLLQRYQQSSDKSSMGRSFVMEFEGLKFLALNTARCNSLTFSSKDVPETGHDALCGFYWNGQKWTVSLYHAKHRTDLDLSQIAVRYGGGGHKGACGFTTLKTFPFSP